MRSNIVFGVTSIINFSDESGDVHSFKVSLTEADEWAKIRLQDVDLFHQLLQSAVDNG